MKKEKDLFVAVLIDGDNASSEKMEDVMRFVSRYGTAVVRRIYGDWTKKKLSGWKDAARDYSFRMVQASSFVQGKNTTDIALVMDAMDILHEGRGLYLAGTTYQGEWPDGSWLRGGKDAGGTGTFLYRVSVS